MHASEPQRMLENRSNLIASGHYDKALIKNLRSQSPFAEGTRNRDFVNPSLTSNVVFYNHGLERVDNPHIRVPKHEWRPSGYNLEDYVAQDAHRSKDMPFKPASDKHFADVVKRVMEKPKVDEDARSNAPERHYQRSRKSEGGSQRAHSAHAQPAGEPTHWHANTQTAETGRPADHSARSANRERIAEHSARGRPEETDKLSRSADRVGRAEAARAAPAHAHAHPHAQADVSKGVVTAEAAKGAANGAGEAVYDLAHNKIGNVSKDKQPFVIIDKDGVSRCGTIYEKISDSKISHPDNLICDNCVNKNVADDKLKEAQRQRDQDIDFAKKVNDNMRQQLEDERHRQLEKLNMYQQAIDSQLRDAQAMKEAKKAAEDAENEKIRQQLGNRDDEVARLERDQQKKQKFIGDLKNQMDDKKAQDAARAKAEEAEDRRNPNLLIDDGWRAPHRQAMKDYYKNYLVDQVNEQERNKDQAKEKQKQEDDEYKRKLAQLNADEAAKNRMNEDDKRRMFMDEIQKQLADKDKMKDWERRIKDAEDDNHRRKLEADRQVYLDNLFKKKQQMDDYLNSLGKQIVDKDMEKRIQELERKKRYNTTLCLGKKPVKCYNCAVCRSIYPLKMLNKRHRIAE